MAEGIREISVDQLRSWMEGEPESVFVLDVRERDEHEVASVEGAVLIPMREVQSRLAEIPTDRRVAVMCHHGGRSMAICRALSAAGRDRLYNVSGGIDQWSVRVDPSVPRS